MRNENSRVNVSSQSIDSLGGIRYALIKNVNYEISLLRDDKLAKYLKHDTSLLAGLVALLLITEEYHDGDMSLEQVEEWEQIYTEWFTKKKFRSEKAKKHNEMTLKVFNDLKKVSNPGKLMRRDWVIEEKMLYEPFE